MKVQTVVRNLMVIAILFLLAHIFPKDNPLICFLIVPLMAHCDTVDGPVVKAARQALETGKVEGVLMWVDKDSEGLIREAFEQARKVRALSPEAEKMADMYFFETLVRIHRAGEGEPYSGLKPEGTQVDPGIALADKAVEKGSVEELAGKLTAHVEKGIREKFGRVTAAKEQMNDSVEAGRKYVAAYVSFIHYIEAMVSLGEAAGEGHHH